MPSAPTDRASSPEKPSNALPGAANRNGPASFSNVVNMALSPPAANAKLQRSSSPQQRATNSPALPADQPLGGAKAALSFVRRIGLRKPPPNNALQQSGADGDGSLSPGSDASGAIYQLSQPIVTETEVIEPMVPGSNYGSVVHDDTLDALVMPPALEHSTVAEYVATAENWILKDQMLAQHEEFVARGLLMIRNLVRCEPRYAAQASGNWLPLVRDSLGSKHGLVRAAAASALAAFAASTPHREAIHKDAQVVPRLVQMLTNGLAAGGDNNDTQYACLALSNMALNSSYRQPLLRYGALPRAADVLRAAIRYIDALNQGMSSGASTGSGDACLRSGKSFKGGAGKGSSGGSGSGNGGRPKSSSMLKSAAYVAALFTAWAVEPQGREQLQQYDVPSLASELYESCVTALGDEFPLSRRLALLADTSSAAALLEEIAGVAEEPGVANWEAGSPGEHAGEGGNGSANGPSLPAALGNPHANALRGVSFMEAASRGTGTGMGRTATAMNSLHRLIDAESPSEPSTGGLASPRSRALSKKQLAGALANAHTTNGSVPSSPIMGAPLLATTTTITATTSTTVTTASPMPLSPTLLSPRDGTIGGSGMTPRGSKLFSSRPSQAGLATFPSAAPLGAQQTSAGQLTSPFAQRQSGFSEAGFHGQNSGVNGLASPVASQHQQLSPTVARSGSMSGVHFSASVFVDAAAARGGHGDDDGQRRSGQSLLTQLTSQPSSKALKLPAVASGRVSESTGRSSGPLSARSSEHQSTGGRLDLPFHLVRPIPTISASSGKVSRISAAYGQVANSRQPSSSGSAHPLHSYPRGYASEL
ncbi:hypothetical protein Vretimale_19450 [Volvox reticuliferus]|uniref:Uncharacterized protein n=1 Tax=Volvox reticuliferus TaxID=1737510 RepID=A0A8J4H0U8_9CHLO|nr:hypothetical protein Vretimale_19450 [Volvox reticuliferus]